MIYKMKYKKKATKEERLLFFVFLSAPHIPRNSITEKGLIDPPRLKSEFGCHHVASIAHPDKNWLYNSE